MTLEIEIRINGTHLAHANASNIGSCTDLAVLSDYAVEACTTLSLVPGAPRVIHEKIFIYHHKRIQSIWALVAKIATTLARRENVTPTRARIRELASAQFGPDTKSWMREPNRWFDNAPPDDLIKTAAGRRMLATYLLQLEFGVYR